MAASDYQGRIIDVLAFAGAASSGRMALDQSLEAGEFAGFVCTGIQKLAQRWLLEFLTEAGSIPYRTQRGCAFPAQLRRGFLRTELEVFQAFALSKTTIASNLQAEETGEEEDDERYQDSVLEQIEISPGFLTLRIRIVSRAGVNRKIILPIPLA